MANTEQSIREYDEQGRLTVAGYQWLEERQIFSLLKLLLIELPLFVATPMAGMYFLNVLFDVTTGSDYGYGGYPHLILSGFITVGLGLLFYKLHRTGIWRKRAILFHRSGEVSAPYGLADKKYFSRTRPLLFNFPGRIISIEMRAGRNVNPVNIYFSDGLRVLIDVNSDFDDARTIAVQLTSALQELRSDALKPPEAAQVVIN